MEQDFKNGDVCNLPPLNQITEENKLNFQNCNVTDEDVKAIAEALKKNHKNPTELDLSKNQITDVGALAIKEALESNANLILIDLRGNKISSEILKEINESLKKNIEKKLTKVTLEDLREPLPPEIQNYEEGKKDQSESSPISVAPDIAPVEFSAQQDGNSVNIVVGFDEASREKLYDLREPLPEGYAEEEGERKVVIHMNLSHFISDAEKEARKKQRQQDEKFVTETTSPKSDVPPNSLVESSPPTDSSPRTSISNPIAAGFKTGETKGNTQG